jgi:hypothetical protein
MRVRTVTKPLPPGGNRRLYAQEAPWPTEIRRRAARLRIRSEGRLGGFDGFDMCGLRQCKVKRRIWEEEMINKQRGKEPTWRVWISSLPHYTSPNPETLQTRLD